MEVTDAMLLPTVWKIVEISKNDSVHLAGEQALYLISVASERTSFNWTTNWCIPYRQVQKLLEKFPEVQNVDGLNGKTWEAPLFMDEYPQSALEWLADPDAMLESA